ncbi:hypothetical protein Pint_22630 [Pistacia integerrima]|uniref:Uncharacterized protein n=1 Tax=Pistacia integerrima TaxID=434235 RepID=A0ACC0YLZ3_9ROSI|nr:hypothetical protein Pint_22630 [Pistacia integerrima]
MEVGGFAAIVMLEGVSLVAIQSLIVDIRQESESEREREERGDGAKWVRFRWQTVQECRTNVETTNCPRRPAPQEKKTQWYREGVSYWDGVEASVDGVLGGFGGSSTAIASPASVSGGNATGSMHEPAQVKSANASDYAVPSLTFSYNAGGSQQSTSSTVINSNPSASPVAFQPLITRSASSSAIASPASVSGGNATGSMHEPAKVKFANAPDYAVPSLTFFYNAGGFQQSTSSSVINSNPSASPVVFEPLIPGSASSSGTSFSYNISQTAVGFLANQHLKSNMVRVESSNKCGDNKLAKKASPTRRLSGTVKVFHIGNGFGKVNDVDIKGSEAFLQTLFFERFNNATRTQHLVALTMLMEFLIVLDCGFGIGRITKNLLISYFNEMMEVRGLVAVVKLASPSSFPIAQFRSFLSESDFIFAQFRSFLSGSDFHFGN